MSVQQDELRAAETRGLLAAAKLLCIRCRRDEPITVNDTNETAFHKGKCPCLAWKIRREVRLTESALAHGAVQVATAEQRFLEDVLSHLNYEHPVPHDEELWIAKMLIESRLNALTKVIPSADAALDWSKVRSGRRQSRRPHQGV
jgi:hypothetical protein